MKYTKWFNLWKNKPDLSTPLDAAAMNHLEDGIANALTAEDLSGFAPKSNTILDGLTEVSALKITGGTPAAGKVWVSDAWGVGSWQPVPSSALADGVVTKPKLSAEVQATLTKADLSQSAAQVQAIANAAAAAIVDGSAASLDTLKELAAALGNDPNFATTVTNLIGTKVASTDPRLSDARAPLNHSADKITSGFLNVGRGGIGRTDLPAERYLRGNGAGSVITDSYETVLANIGAAPKASPVFTGVAETPELKITGGTPGAGKVWMGTDDTGAATWQAPASGGVTIDDENEISQTKTWSAFKLYRDMMHKQDTRVSFVDPDSGEEYMMDIPDWMNSVGQSLDKFAVDASAGKVWTAKNGLGDGEWRTPTGGGGGGHVREFLGTVSSESRMLLNNPEAQVGDWCHRTDLGSDWELIAIPPEELASWQEYAGGGSVSGDVVMVNDWVANQPVASAVTLNSQLMGCVIDPETDDLIPIGISLQRLTAVLYNTLIMTLPTTIDRVKMIPGAVTAGLVPARNGFIRDPSDSGNALNVITRAVFVLDTPSTSGPVRLQLVNVNADGSSQYSYGGEYVIPQGQVYAEYVDVDASLGERGDRLWTVVEVLAPGVGASGLTVQISRQQ